MGNEAILLFLIAGFIFVFGAVVFSKIISPKWDTPRKWDPYECGVETIGPNWIQFKAHYYLIALLFLIFDVEVVFLVPWAVAFKSIKSAVPFIEILIFFVVLGLGLLYALKKKAIDWD